LPFLFSKHQAVKADFHLNESNAGIIADICTRLDGLPLAIELAATRMSLLSPQQLLARLEQRLQVLTGGSRDLPTRQQTLRSTIQWSYDLLNVEEQRLFRRLAIFLGGSSIEAVESQMNAAILSAPCPLLFVNGHYRRWAR
jgi:predicted ATPase